MITSNGKRALACGVAVLLAAPAQAQLLPGPEWRVNTYLTGNQSWPAVAADPNGHFWIGWSGAGPGDDAGVFVRPHLSSGLPVGTEFRVNSSTVFPASFPALAASGSRGFVLTWEALGADGDRLGVFGRQWDAFGNPLGMEFQANTLTSGYQFDSDVAVGPDGTFVTVWTDAQGVYPSLSYTVMGQRYAPSGVPQGANFRLGSYLAPGQHNADFVFDGYGNAIAVWGGIGLGDPDGGIFARLFDAAGGAIGQDFRVNSDTIGQQGYPSVDAAGDGRFVVVWHTYDPLAGYEVRGQRFTAPGAPIGGEFALNTYTLSDDVSPRVAMQPDGRFLVAWTAAHPDHSEVSAQEYAANGNRVGGEFQVDSTPGDPLLFGIEKAKDSFVLVWHQPGATGLDVFARGLGDWLFGDGFNRWFGSPDSAQRR